MSQSERHDQGSLPYIGVFSRFAPCLNSREGQISKLSNIISLLNAGQRVGFDSPNDEERFGRKDHL